MHLPCSVLLSIVDGAEPAVKILNLWLGNRNVMQLTHCLVCAMLHLLFRFHFVISGLRVAMTAPGVCGHVARGGCLNAWMSVCTLNALQVHCILSDHHHCQWAARVLFHCIDSQGALSEEGMTAARLGRHTFWRLLRMKALDLASSILKAIFSRVLKDNRGGILPRKRDTKFTNCQTSGIDFEQNVHQTL